MSRLLLSIVFLLFGTSLMAQERTVTGTVLSGADNSPLPGVNVSIKGTTVGTITNIDGKFTLKVPSEESILAFSFIGFTSQEITVDGRSVIDIQLQEDNQVLSEVVVVGYGQQNKRDLTGSVTSIKGEEINNLPVASVDLAMQGRSAGVNVSSPSGTPGAGISVQIRGSTSLSASSQPLYVIDGIPMIQEDLSTLFTGGQATNSLADLNPADIESLEILKDASATAIYGSRGANGVVLITTKRGKKGQANIDFNAYYGVQNVTNTIEMQSSQEFLALMNDAAVQDNRDLGTTYPENYVSDTWGFDPNDPDLQNTDWYDEIFDPASIQNYDLAISGGNDKTRYYTSLSYFDQNGVQLGTGFERFSGRVNLDAEMTNWLDIGTSINVNRTIQDRTINDNSIYGVVINTIAGDPLMPVFEEDGAYADPFSYQGWWMLDNPVLIAKEYSRFTKTTRGLASIFAEATLSEGLTFKSQISADYTNLVDEAYTPSISRESGNRNANGFGVYGSTQDFTWLVENYLSYNKEFSDKHSLNAVLGNSYQSSNRNFVDISAERFPNDEFTKLSVAALTTVGQSTGTIWGLSSYFARLNYGFDNRYLFTLTGRYDGSSRFGANQRFGFFPSASAAWRISEETFMENVDVVSDLKLRASYGITGNQDGIGNFASRGLFGASAYRQQAGISPSQLSNPNLSWESTSQLDIGIDFGLFEDRLTFTVDYFRKTTNDLLLNRLIQGTSGFSDVTENIGEIENRGFEFSTNAFILTGDLKWSSNFNISFIRNEIKKLEVDEQVISDSHILAEGHPIGTFFLIDQDGVDPQTGNMIWDDFNNDGAINSGDRQIVGNAQPDFFGGFTNNFTYKGFDLNIFFQFVYGNEIFNHSRASYENLGWSRIGTGFPLPDGNNWTGVENRWREPGDVTDIPRASLENGNWREYSSRWIEDGSFLRLKTVNFGYTLPKNMSSKIGLRKLRFYLQGQNLLTFTGYTGLDPEVSQNARDPRVAGRDFGTLPQMRSISLGVNVGL